MLTHEEREELRSEARDEARREAREATEQEFELLPKGYQSCLDRERARKPMTIKELHDAVTARVPKAARVDVSLTLRTQEPRTFCPEGSFEVLAEISVWTNHKYYGVDAPTCEAALKRFEAEVMPEIFPPVPEPVAPALERLADMEPKT